MNKEEISAADKTGLLAQVPLKTEGLGYGYVGSMEAAGVEVLDYKEFGSYQGDWFAKVRFPNGEEYFVKGSYGSCTGCDAFQAEFGYLDDEDPQKLRDFGLRYLSFCMTKEQALASAARDLEWDLDAQEMVDWVQAH